MLNVEDEGNRRSIRFLKACSTDIGLARIIGALFLSAVANSVVLAFPFSVTFLRLGQLDAKRILAYAVLIIGPLVAWALLGLVSGFINSRLLQELRSVSKLRLYREISSKERGYFILKPVGSLENLISLASSAVRNLFFESAIALSKVFGTIIAATVAIFLVAPPFVPIFLIWVVAFLYLSVWLAKRSASRVARAVRAASDVSAHLVDTFANIELVKTANTEAYEAKLLGECLRHEERAYDDAQRDIEKATATQRAVIVFVVFAGALVGQYYVSGSSSGLATTLSLLFMLFFASLQVEAFGRAVTSFLEYFGRLRTALVDLDVRTDHLEEVSNPARHSLKNGNIELRGVSFAYKTNQLALSNITLTIPVGEKVGIIGPSGAGKSTLVRLIRGHLLPSEGEVLIDDIDTKFLSPMELGQTVAFISQETSVLNRSLVENVCYGLGEKIRQDRTKIMSAINSAGLAGVVERVGGTEATVGEKGLGLSGGERQRIALARAILSQESILIMDEATSAINIESERELQRTLFDHFHDKTIIIIAHRLSSLSEVKRLIFLENGCVVEDGPKAVLETESSRILTFANRTAGEE